MLLGAFGQGNYGDEWILRHALDRWPHAKVRARGGLPPGATPAGPAALSPPDLVVLPGGALFQDRTGPLSALWYFAECAAALARGARLVAYDQDFSELTGPGYRGLVARLFSHHRARLLLRPGQEFPGGAAGPDGVGPSGVTAGGGGGIGWAPSPFGGPRPPGADIAFLADRRPVAAATGMREVRHRPGDLEGSHRLLAGLDGLVSGRYHPLLLRWSLSMQAAGTGLPGGKVHALCRRAGYPFYALGGRPKGPREPRRAWRGAQA